MGQKLIKQIAWLERLENDTSFDDSDFQTLILSIIENRKYFQHERLIHLMVTLFFGILMIFSIWLSINRTELLYGVLVLIVSVLEIAYIIHYYRLENGVQKLWEIEQRLYKKHSRIEKGGSA